MRLWKTKKRAIGQAFRTTILGAVVVLALVSVAHDPRSLAAAQEQAKPSAVSIDNFSFTPMELTISAGTPVTWTNKDDLPHTIVSVDHGFKSQALDTGEKFSFTFQDSGTFEYFCSIHPKMVAKIIVK
jgi:plastocyanin